MSPAPNMPSIMAVRPDCVGPDNADDRGCGYNPLR